MPTHLDVRRGVYLDSVTLMQVSRDVAAGDGIRSALVAMATELNLDLLADLGFAAPPDVGPSDLLVAVDAAGDDALDRALAVVESALTARAPTQAGGPGGFGEVPAPRTVASALRQFDAPLALVSTPGRYAFLDAMDALEAGRSVMLFSDNVPVEHEVALKEEAGRRGLLVMGPDCGTAVVSGVGLGFANVVRPGPVGIVAASGTGAQQLMSLLDAAGVGISHCLGVGSRDLKSDVGGRSTLAALDLLAGDATTEMIVVLSKPPDAEVADAVRARADAIGTPVLFGLQGAGQPDLTATAEAVAAEAGGHWQPPSSWPAPEPRTGDYRFVRGLFSGGTLAEEARLIAAAALDEPVGAEPGEAGHVMVDLGDDRFTQGRPHPMIDGSLRTERLLDEAADPDCGVVLLDVVLGHGAHPDPAAELGPAIGTARKRAADRADEHHRDLAVVIALVGTAGDPQGLERQATALQNAGASVHLSNAAAAREAVRLVEGTR
ncbi:MAG: FdrA family protein [Actinomycetota bacterium]